MIEELLKANQEFLAHQPAGELVKAHPRRQLAVVTCMSAHLVDFLPRALGLERGDAVFIQNAGGTITSQDNSIIRSLAVAVYTLGVKDVAVIGHQSCGMKMDVAPLADSFAKYGKTREMLKDFDLREWFGLVTNEELNVRKVVDAIKASPVIPKEISVYGLMIDGAGKLREIYRPEYNPKAAIPVTSAPAGMRPMPPVPAISVMPEIELTPLNDGKAAKLEDLLKPIQRPEPPKKIVINETKHLTELSKEDARKAVEKELLDKFKKKMME